MTFGSDGGDPRWKLWAEAVRTWLPLLISVCAISLTIFQAIQGRRHTRLSVQPRIEFRLNQDAAGTVALSMINVGLGPAVVREVTLAHGDADLGDVDPQACADLDQRLGRDGPDWDTSCFVQDGDYVLRAGDQVLIYESRAAEGTDTTEWRDRLIDYAQIDVDARYCSFYEECWRTDDEE